MKEESIYRLIGEDIGTVAVKQAADFTAAMTRAQTEAAASAKSVRLLARAIRSMRRDRGQVDVGVVLLVCILVVVLVLLFHGRVQ